MGPDGIAMMVVIGVVMVLVGLGVPVVLATARVKAPSGHALIINKASQLQVSFAGGLVFPGLHRAELIDISVKTIEIDRRGKEGLRCRDGVRADVKVKFFVRINKTAEDVLKVAQALGAERASQPETLQELFTAKFAGALEDVASNFDFRFLASHREEFREEVLKLIGYDLEGFVLDDLAIESLAQTPIAVLDPNDILDAQGIRTITEATTEEQMRTNELRQRQTQMLARLELETKQLLVDMERQQADALGRLRAETGRSLTVEQLEDRVVERLRKMVDEVVTERLGKNA